MRFTKFRVLAALVTGGFLLGMGITNAHAQTTYGPGAGGALIDGTTAATGVFTSDIIVSGTGATISTFNSVTISGFTHSWLGDLEIVLTKQGTGENVILMSAPDNEDANLNGTYTFVVNPSLQTLPEAAVALSGAQVVTPGSYAISSYGGSATVPGPRTSFAAFTGIALAGTWRLSITDFAAGDTGAITSWQFNATPAVVTAVPEPTTLGLMATAGVLGGVILKRRRK